MTDLFGGELRIFLSIILVIISGCGVNNSKRPTIHKTLAKTSAFKAIVPLTPDEIVIAQKLCQSLNQKRLMLDSSDTYPKVITKITGHFCDTGEIEQELQKPLSKGEDGIYKFNVFGSTVIADPRLNVEVRQLIEEIPSDQTKGIGAYFCQALVESKVPMNTEFRSVDSAFQYHFFSGDENCANGDERFICLRLSLFKKGADSVSFDNQPPDRIVTYSFYSEAKMQLNGFSYAKKIEEKCSQDGVNSLLNEILMMID